MIMIMVTKIIVNGDDEEAGDEEVLGDVVGDEGDGEEAEAA